jgi:aconitate hydratase
MGKEMFIYDAAMLYQQEQTPVIIVAGKEYGSGSSRDWAAKGVMLLGVKAVIAESFERIHRSNLIGMWVMPLEFTGGDTRVSLGITGHETLDILVDDDHLSAGSMIQVLLHKSDGSKASFTVKSRVDTAAETDYLRSGGILRYALQEMAG